jgi:hypothetical protein
LLCSVGVRVVLFGFGVPLEVVVALAPAGPFACGTPRLLLLMVGPTPAALTEEVPPVAVPLGVLPAGLAAVAALSVFAPRRVFRRCLVLNVLVDPVPEVFVAGAVAVPELSVAADELLSVV